MICSHDNLGFIHDTIVTNAVYIFVIFWLESSHRCYVLHFVRNKGTDMLSIYSSRGGGLNFFTLQTGMT
jgi:hypothetical protein